MKDHAVAFFHRIETAKGPRLGTNFTLTSPCVVLAHYRGLDLAAVFGVPAKLLHISVGLEDVEDLKSRFANCTESCRNSWFLTRLLADNMLYVEVPVD
jgi:cystathionine gamma-synthase